MHSRFQNAQRLLSLGLILTFTAINGCGSDNGQKPQEFGAVRGTVSLPVRLVASGEPLEGVTVGLAGADFDTSTITDVNGTYILGSLPAGSATLTAEFGECLGAPGQSISIPANDTLTANIGLTKQGDCDSLGVDWTGAIALEIDPSGSHAAVLYGKVSPGGSPGILVMDLQTGLSSNEEFQDLDSAFAMKFVAPGLVVFNYLSASGFGLRFYNTGSMTIDGNDVSYHSSGGFQHAGRLAADETGENVFVTHTSQNGGSFLGSLYAVSVSQRQPVDPDKTPFDGNFAFDANLVSGAIKWAYNVAFDAATNEILVGNRQDGFITAIDWAMWGDFDRDAGLSVPTTGVRLIDLSPAGFHGFAVESWGFDDGHGVAVKNISGQSPMVHYESGSDTYSNYHIEETVTPVSTTHTLKVVPSRSSWFTLFDDPDRLFAGRRFAIEERALGTLERTHRFESQFFDDARPTAFGIDPTSGLLYVAYQYTPVIEVFSLP